jgi:hypothetical protein
MCPGARVTWAHATATITTSAAATVTHVTISPNKNCRPHQAQQDLELLDLSAVGHTSLGQPSVPSEEAQVHR